MENSIEKTSSELQREIDADRLRIEDRIDAIQERMSPGQLIDEMLAYAKSSGGGEYVRISQLLRPIRCRSLVWGSAWHGSWRNRKRRHLGAPHLVLVSTVTILVSGRGTCAAHRPTRSNGKWRPLQPFHRRLGKRLKKHSPTMTDDVPAISWMRQEKPIEASRMPVASRSRKLSTRRGNF